MKKCGKCKKKKHSSSFGKSHRYSDGLRTDCRDCERERSRVGNLKRKEENLIYQFPF